MASWKRLLHETDVLESLSNVTAASISGSGVLGWDATTSTYKKTATPYVSSIIGNTTSALTLLGASSQSISIIGADGTGGTGVTIKGNSSTSNYTRFTSSAIIIGTSSTQYTLPYTTGTTGQVLSLNSSGALEWTTPDTGLSISGTAGNNNLVAYDIITQNLYHTTATWTTGLFDAGAEAIAADKFFQTTDTAGALGFQQPVKSLDFVFRGEILVHYPAQTQVQSLVYSATYQGVGLADRANATAKTFLVLGTATSTKEYFLIRGMATVPGNYFEDSVPNAGQPIYLGATGKMRSGVPPSGSTSRLLGHMWGPASTSGYYAIYFNPSNDWVTIA
jgi:hypothetical protein